MGESRRGHLQFSTGDGRFTGIKAEAATSDTMPAFPAWQLVLAPNTPAGAEHLPGSVAPAPCTRPMDTP